MKTRREMDACRDFVNFYNQKKGASFELLRHGEQGHVNEPDCICSGGLNIEIVGVYCGDTDARLEWQLYRKEITVQQSNESQPTYTNPNQLVFSFLETEWAKKEKKLAERKYDYSGKIFLLIDARNTALTEFEDYAQYFIRRPSTASLFDEVWLRAFVNGDSQSRFLQIFPRVI